ncbi:hypothetical protein [Roseovarius sp. MBR-154]
MRPNSLAVVVVLCASQGTAQAPLSAIDWLDEADTAVLGSPYAPRVEPPAADRVVTPEVVVSALDAPRADAVGLLPSSTTGLPASLWRNSAEATLLRRLRRLPEVPLPAVQALYYTLLLAEAEAPTDSGTSARFLSVRLAALRRFGAVEPALALVERADGATPDLFDQWLDLALLNGSEEAACAALSAEPHLSDSLAARIYCIARQGDWDTAALTYHGATATGGLPEPDATLLALFLDPSMIEDIEPPAPPEQVTPLQFRLFEAIGAPLPTRNLPRAFAMADLRGTAGWKAELEAAERLARTGALPGARLLGLYTARDPAASGGVWDRVAAVQALDRALDGADPEAVARSLPEAWRAARAVQLETVYAELFAERLLQVDLPTGVSDLAFSITLLSSRYETAAQTLSPRTPQQEFAAALARGAPSEASPTGPVAEAVARGFARSEAAPEHQALIDGDRLGEAILEAARELDQSAGSARDTLSAALATLRDVGLEDTARRASLQMLLLERLN